MSDDDDHTTAVRTLTDPDVPGGPAAVIVLAESWRRALRILRLKDATLRTGIWPNAKDARRNDDGGALRDDAAWTDADLALAVDPPIPVTVRPPWASTDTRGVAYAIRIGLGYDIGVAVRLPDLNSRPTDHYRVYDPAHITHVEMPL